MHTIDLKNFSLRTDLIIDSNDNNLTTYHKYKFNNGEVIKCYSKDKKDNYITISFNDITDINNYKKVEEVFINELKELYKTINITEKDPVLVIGLGNRKSTPDALGPMITENILVTKYLFSIGDVEEGYQNVCTFKPDVTGTTGIETTDVIKSITEVTNAKCIIILDALAASSTERLNKIIQITNTGIHPGSGVSNDRGEISKETMNIPVIAIGVPTIVDANTIVADTFVKIDNFFTQKDSKVLGTLSELTKSEFKQLLKEIKVDETSLMVTPKEIDFLIEKLSILIANGINKTLHKNYIRQNN